MSWMDDSNTLYFIDTLLKYGNFTKAAKALYVSQPYLTQKVKKIERELGVQIVDRHGAGVGLTQAGKMYHQYLKTLKEGHEAFQATLSKYASPTSTGIRIGILSSLGTFLLPLYLPQFASAHPKAQISVNEAAPEVNETKLLEGELDFFIGQNPETITSNLTIHTLGKHNYYVIVPETSKLYRAGAHLLEPESLDLKDLLQENLVLTTKGSAIRRHTDYLVQKYKVKPHITVETGSIYTVVSLAQKGAGVTIAPEPLLDLNERGPYNLYPLSRDLIYLHYFIAHLAHKALTPIEEALLAHFLAQPLIESSAPLGCL